jgi:DNA-binding NarL/FixJ family response regulator
MVPAAGSPDNEVLALKKADAVARTRTAIVTLSPLLRDIVAALVEAYVPLNIVVECDNRAEAAARIVPAAPDLIFVGLHPGEEPNVGLELLSQVPAAKVITISSDGRNVDVHEMRPCRTTLLDVSPRSLAAAVTGRSVEDLDPSAGRSRSD